MFHELESSIDFVYCVIIFVPYMRCPTLTIIKKFCILLWCSINFTDIPLYLFLGQVWNTLEGPGF